MSVQIKEYETDGKTAGDNKHLWSLYRKAR